MKKRKSNHPNLDRDTLIKDNHYQWCVNNGRNVNWYNKLKDDTKSKKNNR